MRDMKKNLIFFAALSLVVVNSLLPVNNLATARMGNPAKMQRYTM